MLMLQSDKEAAAQADGMTKQGCTKYRCHYHTCEIIVKYVETNSNS